MFRGQPGAVNILALRFPPSASRLAPSHLPSPAFLRISGRIWLPSAICHLPFPIAPPATPRPLGPVGPPVAVTPNPIRPLRPSAPRSRRSTCSKRSTLQTLHAPNAPRSKRSPAPSLPKNPERVTHTRAKRGTSAALGYPARRSPAPCRGAATSPSP